jgi:4-hydroxybenzoate polyprenyltransferase
MAAKLTAFARLCRIQNCAAIFVFCYGWARLFTDWTWPTILTVCVAWALAAAFAYVQNDIVDSEIDAVSHPTRPLPSKRLSRPEAMVAASMLAASCFLLSLFRWQRGLPFLMIAFVATIMYSSVIRHRSAPVSNLISACLTILVIFSIKKPVGSFSATICVLVFAVLLARELVKDILDEAGDCLARPKALMRQHPAIGFIILLGSLIIGDLALLSLVPHVIAEFYPSVMVAILFAVLVVATTLVIRRSGKLAVISDLLKAALYLTALLLYIMRKPTA